MLHICKISLLLLTLLTSCGYHLTKSEETTLSIPYIKGDVNGAFTNSLIKAFATSGEFQYTDHGATLLLEGKIISDKTQNIGYQFQRDPSSGKRTNRLLPSEGRREITVEIILINTHSQKTLYGPLTVSAHIDYDSVDSTSLRDTSFISMKQPRQSVLSFSLGQLDSIDGAKETALEPLYHRLALKIVEGISNVFYTKE